MRKSKLKVDSQKGEEKVSRKAFSQSKSPLRRKSKSLRKQRRVDLTVRKDYSQLEGSLGVKFRDRKLLVNALIHRSFINENRNTGFDHNERLEFLGDAVLELVATEHLFRNYDNPEGELTNWRSSLVNSAKLAEKSKVLGVDDFLFLSRGEAKDHGRARDYILGNAFEAIVGALYLDQGFSVCKEFIERVLLSDLPMILEQALYLDPKSTFQEKAQAKLGITPEYRVLSETGPDHNKKFTVGVYVGEKQYGKGMGSSKQKAQTEAAADALKETDWEQL